jgi:4-amino-4-deoxy-L-arabinose transferase-like glycosyltransferase
MVAWLIRLSTAIVGSNELGVRLPGVLLSAGTIGLSVLAACSFTRRFRDLLAVEVLLMAFPMLYLQAAIITPDTPAAFFITASIAAALWCLRKPSTLTYIVLGLVSGLAMLSKYTTLIPIATLFVYLAVRSPRHLPRIVLAGLLATAILSPMLLWNYHHDWASFRFQISHGTKSDDRIWVQNFLEYVGGQFLLGTPVLFPLMMICVFRALRRKGGEGSDAARRMLAMVSIVTLVFFAMTSLRHKVELNWASLAYPPLLILLALEARSADKTFAWNYRNGLIVGVCVVAVFHLPVSLLADLAPRSQAGAIGGWRELAEKISVHAGGRPVVCTRYQDASLFSFYLPSQPDVPTLRLPGDRITLMDIEPKPLPSGEFLLITDGKVDRPRQPFMVGDREVLVDVPHPIDEVKVELGGRRVPRARRITVCVPHADDSPGQVR